MPISAEVEAAIKFATFYNSLILETVLFGFSSAFFLLSIYFLLRKGIKSRADAIMLATSTFIQCTSIIHWSLEVTIWCQFVIMAIPLTEPILQARFWMSILCVALTDAFVVWRATMLWTRSPWRVAVSGCIVTLDTAVHLFAMGTTALSPYGFWAPGTASIAVSVLCNLWATVLVANKSWLYKEQITDILRTVRGQGRAMMIVSMLLESGIVPAITWTFLLVASSLPFIVSEETLIIALEGITQISVVYVSGIIIAICLRRSFCGEIQNCELEFSLDTYFDPPVKKPMKSAAGGTW